MILRIILIQNFIVCFMENRSAYPETSAGQGEMS